MVRGGTLQSLNLQGAGVRALLGGQPLWTFFPGQQLDQPEVLDGPLYSVLMIAMGLGADLRLAGPVSETALRNAREYQEAWTTLAPGWMRQVEIIPDHVVEARKPPTGRAVSAFSGGLDATFTAIRHARRLLGEASYGLSHALLVHGLDIRLEKAEVFAGLRRRVQPLIDELGLELLVARTNIVFPNPSRPELQPQLFYLCQAPTIAGILHALSGRFDHGLIASSEPYSRMVLPISSNPATDHLLSGEQLQVVHDGAGFLRSQKAELLAQVPAALKALRVCFETQQDGGNCGLCEKCVRTRINLMLGGAADPPCFDQPFHIDMIDAVFPTEQVFLSEWRNIEAYALRKGVETPWMDRIRARLAQAPAPSGNPTYIDIGTRQAFNRRNSR